MAKADRRPTTDDSPDVDESSDPAAGEFPDVADLSYEAARDELTAIVAQLEGGQVPLEEGMRLWRRGEALAAHCTAWLDGAQRQISGA
jgi:exodeoxyribonuclease VII small subunit